MNNRDTLKYEQRRARLSVDDPGDEPRTRNANKLRESRCPTLVWKDDRSFGKRAVWLSSRHVTRALTRAFSSLSVNGTPSYIPLFSLLRGEHPRNDGRNDCLCGPCIPRLITSSRNLFLLRIRGPWPGLAACTEKHVPRCSYFNLSRLSNRAVQSTSIPLK